MNNLSVFDFNSKNVRVVVTDPLNPLFVAKDVANALGYKRANDAIKQHCKGAVKHRTLQTDGGKQKLRVIYEPDVYRLIFGSKLDSAITFQDWVFETVLPSIRKTGSYTLKINAEQQRLIQEAVNRRVIREQTNHQSVYHELKTRFKVPRYNELPAIKFEDCIYWLNNGHKRTSQTITPKSQDLLYDLVVSLWSLNATVGKRYLKTLAIFDGTEDMHFYNYDKNLFQKASKAAIAVANEFGLTGRGNVPLVQNNMVTTKIGSRFTIDPVLIG